MAVAFDLQQALAALPVAPGIYRMFDARDRLIYVGKAKNLRSRVRSYFQKNADHAPKTRDMVQRIVRFDVVVTTTEVEALILEDNLVKTHYPRYNILLRDDKRYPWLCLTAESFPRLVIRRQVGRRSGKQKDKGRYFGPYSSTGAMYQTLKVLRKHFPLRQRRKPLFADRPCINYSIGTCPAPCQQLISQADYDVTCRHVTLLLKGQANELLAQLRQEMNTASTALNFEWAAKLRDRLMAVEHITGQQQTVSLDNPDIHRDVVGAVADDRVCYVVLLQVRHGRVVASQTHTLPLLFGEPLAEAYAAFLVRTYADRDPEDIPDTLVLQLPPETPEVFGELLTQRRRLLRPTRPVRSHGFNRSVGPTGICWTWRFRMLNRHWSSI